MGKASKNGKQLVGNLIEGNQPEVEGKVGLSITENQQH